VKGIKMKTKLFIVVLKESGNILTNEAYVFQLSSLLFCIPHRPSWCVIIDINLLCKINFSGD
jgi:hypothetical protein